MKRTGDGNKREKIKNNNKMKKTKEKNCTEDREVQLSFILIGVKPVQVFIDK